MKHQKLNETVEAIASHMDRDSSVPLDRLEIVRKSKLAARMKEKTLSPSEIHRLMMKASNSFQEEGFSIITKEMFPPTISKVGMDLLAIKRVEISENSANLQVILVSLSNLKGSFYVSKESLYYAPIKETEKQSSKKILAAALDTTQYLQARNAIMHELQHESELLNISVSRSTVSSSSPVLGSSRTSTSGFMAKTVAREISRFSPPDNL